LQPFDFAALRANGLGFAFDYLNHISTVQKA
jgi:hypothetical protein